MREKLKNIEFLRFIFAIMIAFHHYTSSEFIRNSTNIWVKNLPNITFNLPFIVDFFFVISGFFLIYTYRGISETDFIKKKYCQLFPLMFLYVFSIKIFSMFGFTNPSGEPIFSLLLLDSVGLTLSHSGVAWFISAYFFVICFYYFLLKNFTLKNIKLFLFLSIYLSYAFLIHQNNGNIATNKIFYCVINGSILRACAGIAIGCFIAWQYKKAAGTAPRIIYTFLEGLCMGCLIYFLLLKNPQWNSLIYLLVFCCFFNLFLLKRGWISQFFEKNWSVVLGKYALAIYMVHEPLLRIIRPLVFNAHSDFLTNHILISTLLYLSGVLIIAVLAHHFVEVPGAKLMKKLLFPQPATDAKNVGNLEREREREIHFAKLHKTNHNL